MYYAYNSLTAQNHISILVICTVPQHSTLKNMIFIKNVFLATSKAQYYENIKIVIMLGFINKSFSQPFIWTHLSWI